MLKMSAQCQLSPPLNWTQQLRIYVWIQHTNMHSVISGEGKGAHVTHFFKDTWLICPKKSLKIFQSINGKIYDQSTVRLNGS